MRKTFAQLISDRVSDRLRSALATEGITAPVTAPPAAEPAPAPSPESASGDPDVVTTEEELDGFRIVRAIVCSVLPPDRVSYRDAKTYFAILIDDNNRKPLCRLWFNTSQRYLGLLDDEKKETRHPISSAVDIYRFADDLRTAAARYADLLK